MRIGFTGHQNAPEAALSLLQTVGFAMVTAYNEVAAYSSLAAGADQYFAGLVLGEGGELHGVIPCEGYEATFNTVGDQDRYRHLTAAARSVTTLPFPEPSEEAFLAAGIVVAERCEVLLAVWDGEPAAGLGGTADVVAYTRQLGKPVEVVWPEGLLR